VITFAVIIGCIALMFFAASARGKPGRAVADTALLVILLGIVAVLDIVVAQFVDTGNAGQALAIAFAGGFALDALYGLLAPERQRQRDKRLRRLMKRRA